jgi:nucleoside-diphosphate kinase
MEQTFIMLKPSTITRGLIGNILTRFENKGLKITAMKLTKMTQQQADKIYAVHREKPFFKELVQYVKSAPIVVLVVEGEEAVKVIRNMVGSTNAKEAEPGTIRGDLANSNQKNAVHASDSIENAQREMNIFFTAEEIFSYQRADENWI